MMFEIGYLAKGGKWQISFEIGLPIELHFGFHVYHVLRAADERRGIATELSLIFFTLQFMIF